MEEKMLMLISKQLERITAMIEKRQGNYGGKMGRPTKEHIVIQYRISYPEARKMQCARATGLSIKTVSKYWDLIAVENKENNVEKVTLFKGV